MPDFCRDRAGPRPGRVWAIRLGPLALVLWVIAAIRFDLPWYLPLLMIFAGLVGWMPYLAFGPLPALDPHPRQATVTGHTTEVVDELDSRRPVIHVRVDTPGGGFDSVLADHIADDDRDRFVRGSTWSVRVFADTTARVFLSDAHDDVLRSGYDLDGVRMATESVHFSGAPKPGSPLTRHRIGRRLR
ncbi:hypothetical protein [Actinophytocola sp. NPDC049390]|uniref:hypothetical protein n=1 Tax=Actinophytocola sp. NPDC049390 TaxID=3363894 RepID=UPI0037946705